MKVLFLAAISLPLLAQPDYRRHYISAGLGGAAPGMDLSPFFRNSLGATINYGYRFHRNFQADAGLDGVVGAARIREFVMSRFGELRLKDYQYLVPLGGRAILPLASERVLLAGGGGAAYLRYSERLRLPFHSNVRLECRFCRSRSGWGYYGLLGMSFGLDRYNRFRLGVSSRVYRADMAGDPFGGVPGVPTRDQWVNILAEFGITF